MPADEENGNEKESDPTTPVDVDIDNLSPGAQHINGPLLQEQPPLPPPDAPVYAVMAIQHDDDESDDCATGVWKQMTDASIKSTLSFMSYRCRLSTFSAFSVVSFFSLFGINAMFCIFGLVSVCSILSVVRTKSFRGLQQLYSND